MFILTPERGYVLRGSRIQKRLRNQGNSIHRVNSPPNYLEQCHSLRGIRAGPALGPAVDSANVHLRTNVHNTLNTLIEIVAMAAT